MRPTVLLILLAVASSAAYAQATRYVTDSLRLESRSGPGVKNRIVKMLRSGTALTILEERDGWSRFEIEGEGEAWILSRYLMDEASARNQVAEAKAMREGVETRIESIREQLTTATNTAQSLEVERLQLSEREQALATELEQLKRTATSAVAVKDENERLKQEDQAVEAGDGAHRVRSEPHHIRRLCESFSPDAHS